MANWSDILQSLGPGLGRPLGSGDVVPYRGVSSEMGTVSNPEVATPGPRSPFTASFGGDSFLNNLSAIMPSINAFISAQNAAAIPSGQGTALPGTPNAATPGIGSTDITAALNAQAAGGQAGPAPTAPAAPPAPVAAPAPTDVGTFGGGAGPGTAGEPTGAVSDAGVGVGVGVGTGGGEGSDGGSGGPGAGGVGGAGGFRQGGLVGGKPTKGDSVNAKLQPGEFVIPRDAVHHLAATRPDVLNHVMHVSALHALANRARELTGVNGMPPVSSGPATQGYTDGGIVVPRRSVPMIHPAALDAIRRAIALHALVNQARQGAPALDRMVGPAQVAQMSPATGQFGRPAILPPLTPPTQEPGT